MTQTDNATRDALTRQRWTLLLGSLTSFLVGLDALVVTTALPTLHQELGAGVADLSWTVNAYALAFAASILTGSTVGDRFGRRRMFVVGLALFTLASVLCALSSDATALIAARVIQGVGGGIAVPLSLALITDSTPPERRGKALGIWGAITGVAVAAGPLVGGAIVEGIAWQWVFWVNVPVGIGLILLAARKIERGERTYRRLDLAGLALATVGVFGIAQALIRGNDVGWSSITVLAGLIGGATALVLFVVWESRAASPMMPTGLFTHSGFTVGCVAGFVLTAGMYGFGFLTAQYLQLALHNDPLGVGLRLLPATGMALFISPVVGRLADRIGEKPLIATGLGLLAVGLTLIGLLATGASGYLPILGPLLITGVGIAVGFPTVATAVMRSVSAEQTGVASGVSNTFRQVGAVAGIAVAAAIFTGSGSYRTPEEFVNGYRPALIALGLVCAAGAVVAVAVRDRTAPAPGGAGRRGGVDERGRGVAHASGAFTRR